MKVSFKILRILLFPLLMFSMEASAQLSNGAYASAVNMYINGTTQYYNNTTTAKTSYTDQEHAINQGSGDWTSIAITQYAGAGSNSIGTASINSGQIILKGAKVKTYKTGLGNNCTVKLKYKQYRSTATAVAIAALPWFDLPLSLDGSTWNGLASPLGAFSDGDGVCDHEEPCDCACVQVCERCAKGEASFDMKPEHPEWVYHLLNHYSWAKWRENNPDTVQELLTLPSRMPEGWTNNPDEDKSIMQRSDTRKTRLSLKQNNELRKSSEAHILEQEVELSFVHSMYSTPAPAA